MPTNHDETLQERYAREQRELERAVEKRKSSVNTEELKRLAEAATPGPWISGDDEDSDYCLVGPADFDDVVTNPVVKMHSEFNARYIAAANPAAVLSLIAERDELLEALKLAHDHIDMTALEISHCKDAEAIRAAITKAESK